ncbi:MAG: 30S ribosomal protein S20 [Lachnospiraceae bacterium]|nr:30S ribosomal protein S20 [Lachnospiraceae bacterium]
MANIKSAKKRVLVNKKKYERNKSIRSAVKTYIKNVEVAVSEGNKEEASKALTVAIGAIAKASNKGIYHKNNAARKVSRLTKLVDAM